MKHTVNIHINGALKPVSAENGANLLGLLRQNGVHVETPCGGKGTCGKCAVKTAGLADEPSQKERELLGADRIAGGCRLACSTGIISDLDVFIEDTAAREASIVTEGAKRDIKPAPAVTKQYVELKEPSLENQVSDIERVLSASDPALDSYDAGLLLKLPEILRSSAFKVTLVGFEGRLLAVEPGNSTDRLFGAALDIGTTTVAAYLYNLATGQCLVVGSMLNPQRKYGADVISRISHAMQSKDGKAELQSLIVGCINELLADLAAKAGIRKDDIYMAVFAGNTTMMHLMAGLEASNLASAPFVPVTTDMLKFDSHALNLCMNKNGVGIILPGVSAYVGTDTIAAVLSSGMAENSEIALLVDIGTNGEIVLGCRDWMLACATAAGPAFEGANIRNGVGGVKGAIDSVGPAPGFEYTTIGNDCPIGICGSGIIDVTAALLDAGLMDETGRLAGEEEAEQLGPELADRMVSIDGVRAFRLVSEGDKGASNRLVITQKDIRELQNAKAAIAAGIETLVKKSGISADSVKKVYLAGGFGSSIHIESALKIGLLPRKFENRIEAVGNASGAGAAEGLLSVERLHMARKIKQKVKYVELSASAEFTEKYVENMLFPV